MGARHREVAGRLDATALSSTTDAATYDAVAGGLEATLDRAWAAAPNPGRGSAVHRLNRTEYGNAIRDLFALDIDVTSLLPGDETADGSFDNFADVLTISRAHLDRYLSVARQVTRLAVGLAPPQPRVRDIRDPAARGAGRPTERGAAAWVTWWSRHSVSLPRSTASI